MNMGARHFRPQGAQAFQGFPRRRQQPRAQAPAAIPQFGFQAALRATMPENPQIAPREQRQGPRQGRRADNRRPHGGMEDEALPEPSVQAPRFQRNFNQGPPWVRGGGHSPPKERQMQMQAPMTEATEEDRREWRRPQPRMMQEPQQPRSFSPQPRPMMMRPRNPMYMQGPREDFRGRGRMDSGEMVRPRREMTSSIIVKADRNSRLSDEKIASHFGQFGQISNVAIRPDGHSAVVTYSQPVRYLL